MLACRDASSCRREGLLMQVHCRSSDMAKNSDASVRRSLCRGMQADRITACC